MKKSGFTLVELLAVIVVLAIIALITVPITTNIVEEARIGAFRDSVLNAHSLVEHKLFMKGLTEIPEEGIDVMSLDMKSDFESGKFMLDEDGNEIAYFIRNKYFCAYGRMDSLAVSKDCKTLDTSYPVIDPNKMVLTSTINRIQVTLEEGIAEDVESGIKDYELILLHDGQEVSSKKVDSVPATVTFRNLTNDQNYTVKLIVTNGNKMTSSIEKNEKTENILTPQITYTNTPQDIQEGYLKKQVANINYQTDGMTYYIHSGRQTKVDVPVTKKCGTGIMPGSCESITETTVLEADTWYETSKEIHLTYDEENFEEAFIIAYITDGTSTNVISTTGTISKIDTTAPTAKITNTTQNSNNIVLTYNIELTGSSLASQTCKYGTEKGTYNKAGSGVTSTGCVLSNLSQKTPYYYQICATDKVGNRKCTEGNTVSGEITNPVITWTSTPNIDSNGYTKKQVATVTFTKGAISEPHYYIKSDRNATLSANAKASCGTSTLPQNCTNITETKNITAGLWYEVSGSLNVTYTEPSTENGYLTVITYDGTNYSNSAAGTIAKIYYPASSVQYNANGKTNVQEALDGLYDIYMK